ncbi:urea ABC transporter ATP-binding protein UrtD [Mesorhizobium sp. YR577]|uniref:urea ABC transporter ATP-binding protein UrtD n=1 Tax=Mesorhizobium sp. YR577 TaxID=1884373 RepID=UPI0008F412A8|nr:urea ABC transporter ATP-binding protein UrtD [Mesorhizobium sp. YR577]SFU19020.1 urea transport system ATP-binding protein [Mesorhizobium sp. YR577]
MPGVLEIHNLQKNFDAVKVINDFSLEVVEMTLCCLVGPNGAGKTTTMDLITGRQKPTSGRIVFRGDDITGLGENTIAQRGLGRKFQIPAVFKELTVRQNLEVAYSIQVNAIRNLFSFSSRACHERMGDVADQVGLSRRLDVVAGTLSHGETQWLEIGMVLMQDPALLLLDEPVAGMTEQEVEKTAHILKTLKKSKTLIVVEHDMGFVREIADVVTVMHMGSLLAQGTIETIEADQRVRDVYLGTEEH